MTCYRPTTLKLASAHCPRAVDLYEQNAPAFRDHYQVGIAAHDCLAQVGELALKLGRSPDASQVVAVCQNVAFELMAKGRRFEGQQEPPMSAEDADEGANLAIRYATADATEWLTADVSYERGLAFDENWRAVPYSSPARRFRLIPDMTAIVEDAGEDYVGRVALARDYKTAWSTDAGELQSYQMRAQAVALWLTTKDIDGVRIEVVNLRSGQSFGETIWIEAGGRETLEDWRAGITRYMAALDQVGGDGRRPARPGAGCLGCPWALSCAAASPLAQDIEGKAERLAKIEGEREQLIKILKLALADENLHRGGSVYGWHPKPKREPKPDAARLAWEAWKKDGGDIDGFLAALRPSITGLEIVAELLVKKYMALGAPPPESGELDGIGVLDALIDAASALNLAGQWIESKPGREFGVKRRDAA